MAKIINTLFANINTAARNHETVHIGGGEFSPAELLEALDHFKLMGNALERIALAGPGVKRKYLAMIASAALRGENHE